MLILYRRPGQAIRIADHTLVTLMAHNDDFATLRVTTPRGVTVHIAERNQPLKPEMVDDRADYLIVRRLNQCVIINRTIAVTIVGRDRGVMEFGIDAPRQTPVHREEKYQEFKRESADGMVGPGGRDYFPVNVSERGGYPGGPMIYDRLRRSTERVAQRGVDVRGAEDIAGEEGAWGGMDWDDQGDQFPMIGGGRDA